MGRYFGITNNTKSQSVSSYWKGDEWCNCYQVMHQLYWDKMDDIKSYCYDTSCEFKYNEENDKMECINITNKLEQEHYEKMVKYCDEYHKCHYCDKCNECIKCYNCECKEYVDYNDYYKCDETKNKCVCDCEKCHNTIEEPTPNKIIEKKYGFDENMNKEDIFDMLNHVPDWDGGTCKKCNYKYNESLLEEYEKNFGDDYFMS